MCDSKELLVGFLYGELEPTDRRTFQDHLALCAECREELAGLRSTRGQIASWTPPEPDFGFRIVRGAAAPAPPRFRFSPAWAFAAAAVLVMAAAAAISNVEVRYGSDGLVVRTGWSRAGDASTAALQRADGASATPVDWKAQADVLDRRLRELEAIASRAQSPGVQSAGSSDVSDTEVLRRVREMLGQSETRQQRALAVRLAEITRDFDTQRKLDLAAIDQGMARLQSTSGAEVRQYRDLIQRVARAASYQQK
jgi:hypothetical protein